MGSNCSGGNVWIPFKVLYIVRWVYNDPSETQISFRVLQDFSEELDDLGHLHMHFSCSFYDKIVSQTENILPWKVSVFLKHMKLMLYSTKMAIILLEINKTYHSSSNKQITIKWDFLYITHTCFFVVVVFLFF